MTETWTDKINETMLLYKVSKLFSNILQVSD